MSIIKSDIKYLSFEGGGGKGIVYLGAVKALEEIFNKHLNPDETPPPTPSPDSIWLKEISISAVESLIKISQPIDKRQIKGLSGSSAGSIVAFMLSMGMASDQIEEELNRAGGEVAVGGDIFSFIKKSTRKVSPFEKFYDNANTTDIRSVEKNQRNKSHNNFNSVDLKLLTRLLNNVITAVSKVITTISSVFVDQTTITQRLLYTPGPYFNSLLFDRGLFPGFEVREYLQNLMRDYLYTKMEKLEMIIPKKANSHKDPSEITFKDFFYMTGVDLIVTGTNVTKKAPLYFSVYHTPDFPVTEAIGISMNFPLLFKPIYVDYRVHKEMDETYNEKYHGLYVDGGMLNNLPFHAFDDYKIEDLLYQGNVVQAEVGITAYNSNSVFRGNVLGLRLKSDLPNKDGSDIEESLFPKREPFLAFTYGIDLLETLLYPSEEGQIRSETERFNTVLLNATGIAITDFASPKMNETRKETDLRDIKVERIKQAIKSVKQKFGYE
ncbi:MAG TPA: patatin-like phospholipase family protein [Bacteroidia bacterium]|nr:patatin-like phospholipase family protein [Bacteroidia bacterium]